MKGKACLEETDLVPLYRLKRPHNNTVYTAQFVYTTQNVVVGQKGQLHVRLRHDFALLAELLGMQLLFRRRKLRITSH